MNYQFHQLSRVVSNCAAKTGKALLMIVIGAYKYLVNLRYYDEIKQVTDCYDKKVLVYRTLLKCTPTKSRPHLNNQRLSKNYTKSIANVSMSNFGISQSRVPTTGCVDTRLVTCNAKKVEKQKKRVIAVFSK